jgi:carbamoyl-phosphate synthase large subunit
MKAKKTSPVIMVSGLHRGESPQAGGAVIESVRQVLPDARFVGISYDILESGLFSRGPDAVDAAWLLPYPGAGPEALLHRIKEIHAVEGLSLIIPTLDSELTNLIQLRPELQAMGIAVAVPSMESFLARDKPVLPKLAAAVGALTPATLAANTALELAALALRIGYPCYVKGALYDARLVHNEAQLYAAFADIYATWGAPILVQQAIYGEEFVVAGVGDGNGGLLAFCAVRKLLRSKLGKAFGGVVVEDPEVIALSRKLISELRWEGGFEIEFVRPTHAQNYLFEINPRFPAWISFPTKVGCNMPGLVATRALGLPVPILKTCKAGQMFMRHNADLVGDIGDLASMATQGHLNLTAPTHEEV